MAVELRFVTYEYTGGTEAIVGGRTYVLTDYAVLREFLPGSPPTSVVWSQGALPGAWPVGQRVGVVTDRVRVVDSSGYPSTVLENVKYQLARARAWVMESPRVRRVMVAVRDTARYATWYESRLLGGAVTLERGPYFEFTMERMPFWDDPTESTLQVANVSTGGAFANYAAIRDRDDATASNWVKLNNIACDTPTPLRVTVEDKTLATLPDNLGQVRMGWDLEQYSCVLEGEDSLLPKSTTSSSAYSNNAYATASAFYWAVNVAFNGAFRVLAKGDLAGGDWYARLGYDYDEYTGELVTGVDGWTDLGVVVLPPGGAIHPSRRPFYVRIDGSASGDLDFVLLLPIRQYRRLAAWDARAATSFLIEDDGWREECSVTTSAGRFPAVDGYGAQVLGWPQQLLPNGAYQMLVFTQEDFNGVVTSAKIAEVRVYYRARWSVLP